MASPGIQPWSVLSGSWRSWCLRRGADFQSGQGDSPYGQGLRLVGSLFVSESEQIEGAGVDISCYCIGNRKLFDYVFDYCKHVR